MSDLENKLNALLSSPDAMDQIMSMARSLGLGGDSTPSSQPPGGHSASHQHQQGQQQGYTGQNGQQHRSHQGHQGQSGHPGGNGPPPSSPPLDGLGGMLSSLLGGGEGGTLDPKLTGMMLRLASAWGAPDDDKTALLAALRPFLKPERAEKMQRAMQIAKLSRVIRIALDSFKGGVTDV